MIKIFGKPLCQYCVQAQLICKRYEDLKYEYISLGEGYDMNDVELWKETYGHRTFPFVFDGSTFIGGAKELHDYLRL